ncbi:MAG: class I SAM-dependent methyltransferase [Thermoplasmata archaeon]|nr:class I SAM-dependent methyltransferase [Thermoplasmata archaeon]
MDEIAKKNQKFWKNNVASGDIYTRPWLDLDASTVQKFANREIEFLPEPYSYIYPNYIFENIVDKDVLCLASGGGQQSAVFGLLGANVTVFDLTDEQLEGDRKAAAHHGYEITTIQGDMRDLSCFPAESFDMVYHPISLCYVPSLEEIYRQVARVLKPGGLYRVGHGNPAFWYVEEDSWDGKGYRITSPIEGDTEDYGVQFRHDFSDIFNNLVESGFVIKSVHQDPRHLVKEPVDEPGSYEHMHYYVHAMFAIVTQKE